MSAAEMSAEAANAVAALAADWRPNVREQSRAEHASGLQSERHRGGEPAACEESDCGSKHCAFELRLHS